MGPDGSDLQVLLDECLKLIGPYFCGFANKSREVNDMHRKVIGTQALVAVSLIGLAALSLCPCAHAQAPQAGQAPAPKSPTSTQAPTRTPQHGPEKLDQFTERRAQEVGKQIGLTDAQVAQMAQLNGEALRQIQTLFNTRPADKAAARQKLLDVLNARAKALDAVLTPEQREKYSAISQKDGAQFFSELIARKINLSDAQLKQLNPVNQQVITKLRMAQDQPDRAKQLEAIRKTREWKNRQYQRIMTPAQYTSLQQIKQYAAPTNADTSLSTENTKALYGWGTPPNPNTILQSARFGAYSGYGRSMGYGYGSGYYGTGWGSSYYSPYSWVW
jgi:hypothetical protein